jgi:hypothetical protein
MRISNNRGLIFVLTIFITGTTAVGQKLAQSTRILSAKTVYFDNKTGSDAVGKNALAQLRKWGKYQVVSNPKRADLIFLLAADPYRGGNIIMSGGQTGSVDSQGHIEEDRIPDYNKLSPTRNAYLTVIDPKTGNRNPRTIYPSSPALSDLPRPASRRTKTSRYEHRSA